MSGVWRVKMRRAIAGALVVVCLSWLLGACTDWRRARMPRPEDGRIATSLLGRPLFAEPMAEERRRRLVADLQGAREAHAHDPHDEARIIWLGRRLAYLGRFQEAIAAFTRGLQEHPESHRLLRHRGHRFITLRMLERALADLQRAAELIRNRPDAIEPDGMPNALNIPRTTDHSNIYYHLGLVHYLRGEYEQAEQAFAYRENLAEYNDDMLVSTTHWRYLALRRLGRDAEAARLLETVRPETDVIENHAYHRLCLMYKGLISPDELLAEGRLADPATAYGVAAYLGLAGRAAEARELMQRIIAETSWAAFGHIAAEADLAR